MLSFYKKASVKIFGGLFNRFEDSFKPLSSHIKYANMKILLKTWICMSILTAVILYFVSLISLVILFNFVSTEPYIYIFFVVFFPVFIASTVFATFYIYPIERENNKRKSIENNMPFAVTHMSAIASSGIPPEFMFDLLSGFKEYGEISEESRTIVRNMKTFGMSSVDSLRDVAKKTPSKNFEELLMGIVSTIETGGNLVDYLKGISEKALFNYRIRREKYMKTLSTYADLYTALLVTAPLMMLTLLAMMSIIGGDVMGMTIDDLIFLMTWLILPLLNSLFLAFLHVTYPGV